MYPKDYMLIKRLIMINVNKIKNIISNHGQGFGDNITNQELYNNFKMLVSV
jgi:hypothetical protein